MEKKFASQADRVYRDAVSKLSRNHAFTGGLVNSGRLSVPGTYVDSPLNTADGASFAGLMVPGAPRADAPVGAGGRDDCFPPRTGGGYTGMYFLHGQLLTTETCDALRALADGVVPVRALVVVPDGASLRALPGIAVIQDVDGLLWRRYDAGPGCFYLLRPDQSVCGRWRDFSAERVRAALSRAT
jgi:3-(3-hydroxy-phenyl)propionate hydroxylase